MSISLDLKGLSCPIPVLEVKKALKSNPDALSCIVDTFAAKENITRLCVNSGYKTEIKEANGIWELLISK